MNLKQKFTKNRPGDRSSFFEKRWSKFHLNSEADNNISKDDNLTEFNEYGIDQEKSLDTEDVVMECRRFKKTLYDNDNVLWWKKKEEKLKIKKINSNFFNDVKWR